MCPKGVQRTTPSFQLRRAAPRSVDWLKAPIGLAQAPIRRQSMLIGSLRQSGANHLRQSIQAPIRRQSMRQSEEAPIYFFPWGNACKSGVLTGQPAQRQARVADWLKAPIDWLIWRQSGANRLVIDWLKAPINCLQSIGANQIAQGVSAQRCALLVSSCPILPVLSPGHVTGTEAIMHWSAGTGNRNGS